MRSNDVYNAAPGLDQTEVNGIIYRKGCKVILRLGKHRSDISDIIYNNRVATIETIYEDYDGKVYLAVTMDEDPGQQMFRDLNIYRYYHPEETEIISNE
jgi:hypothetical protein